MQKLICDGRLTADAELRYLQGGDPVLNFTVASDVYTGEEENDPLFVRCTIWGKRGEKLAEYLTKGRQVFVTGDVKIGMWSKENRVGVNTELRVDSLTLGAKPIEK